MDTTSPTLLQKLRDPGRPDAWSRFVDLYTPLLLRWAQRTGLQPQDAADLVQEVFVTLVQQLPKFQYDPQKKSFRGWLKVVCLNKWRDRQRKRSNHLLAAGDAELDELPAPAAGDDFWDHEHQQYLVAQALRTFTELQGAFEPQTWRACWEVVVNQRPAAAVAQELAVTSNAVYIARLRVLRRLRQELQEFLD